MILKILSRLAFFYIATLVFVFFAQRWLIYHPSKTLYPPSKYGLSGFKEVEVTASDGIKLLCWYKEAEEGFPTIIYFHGNGGNLSNRVTRYNVLAQEGYGIFAVSYRGYGKNGGKPSEQGLYKDGRAGVFFLKEKGVDDVLIFGESLGTGVAVQMATEFDSKGLILEAPYSSIPDVARGIYFWLPVNLLSRDRFESVKKISKVKSPILIFHGTEDGVINIKYGRKLYNAANQPKKMIEIPEAGHYIEHKLIAEKIKAWL